MDLKYIITPASGDIAEVAILYSSFIQSIIDFLIIAFSIFLFIKLLTSREKNEAEAPTDLPASVPEVVLLEEICNLLKTK